MSPPRPRFDWLEDCNRIANRAARGARSFNWREDNAYS